MTLQDAALPLRRPDARGRVSGIILGDGRHINTQCVILTTGTFLRGSINLGLCWVLVLKIDGFTPG